MGLRDKKRVWGRWHCFGLVGRHIGLSQLQQISHIKLAAARPFHSLKQDLPHYLAGTSNRPRLL